jgi:two-component system response regulator PilR (NtrC family)
MSKRVLIVDDERDILELLELALLRMGLESFSAGSVKEAIEQLGKRHYDLCLTDMRMPDGEGLEIVDHVAKHHPSLPVAVITAHGSLDNAISALKMGAFDYLAKPVSLEQLRALVKSALALPESSEEQGGLLGGSQAMCQVRGVIEKLARSQAPVYISGESGSGKERAARLIHEKSARRDKPFIAVNCGAIPENLMESEFFGYRKGAFTGAEHDQEGFFQAADGGTLFLDEVADLPLLMQVKLLRAIQEKKVRRLGASAEEPVNVRIISATHQNLAECVEKGKLRHDLYYRLNVIALKMPPLREMREDIPLLAHAILDRISADCRIGGDALAALASYDFPGNVRELENILERAAALCSENLITIDDLQLERKEESGEMPAENSLQDYLDRLEKEAILDALTKTKYNRTAAAKLLGVTFRALRYRMERLGIK